MESIRSPAVRFLPKRGARPAAEARVLALFTIARSDIDRR
jgi:hypothetical protein